MLVLLQFSSGIVDEISLVYDVICSEDLDGSEYFSAIHPHSVNSLKKGRCGNSLHSESSHCVCATVHTLDKRGSNLS